MNRIKLISRVRILTRDFSNSIFRENDIIDFINEGIDRFKQIIPQLRGLTYLTVAIQEPSLIPEQYQHLLSVYAASRCFSQDERHYQSTNLMNEFEVKLEELKSAIEAGDIIIVDSDGNTVVVDNPIDYVETKSYWGDNQTGIFDIDLGVEGVTP
jgi:hypothetical protein